MAVFVLSRLLIALVALAYVSATTGADVTPAPTKTRRHVHQREVAETVYDTNAKRFAAGMPPLRPRHLLSPTKVRRSRQSASPLPSLSLSLAASLSRRSLDTSTTRIGSIQVVSDSNNTLWLARSFSADGMYLTTTSKHQALRVQFDVLTAGFAGGSRLSNLGVVWPQDEDCPFLGLVASPKNLDPVDYMGLGNGNRVCLGMTSEVHEPKRSSLLVNYWTHQTTHAHNHLEATESTVWKMTSSVEPGAWTLSPVWVNPDGKRPEGTVLTVLPGGALCLLMTQGERTGEEHSPAELRLVIDS